jgi:hypothetical protein
MNPSGAAPVTFPATYWGSTRELQLPNAFGLFYGRDNVGERSVARPEHDYREPVRIVLAEREA